MNRAVSLRFSFLLLSLLVFSTGCETTLELPVNNLPKLTIIAHLNNSSSWEAPKVYVFSSLSASDSSSFHIPDNLEVEVTELETDYSIRLEMVQVNGDQYFGFPDQFLKEGFSYTISAFAPGFESVRATTRIPKPSTITNLNINNFRIEPSTKNEFKNIVRYTITFDINHFESNQYYHLVFYNQYEGKDTAFLVDPELSDDQPFLRHYDFGILIDREDLIGGEPLSFDFVDWVVGDHDLKKVFVELRTITKEYYKYHSSLARQLIVRQDPFAEPVPIFNNIEGGFGNFSGFSPDVISSNLPE
jgi:hypothetical protein